jgi:MinD superfamily P-loop ATPase
VFAEPQKGDGSPFTLAVASGKGGTGKTLVATNMAALSSARGLRVVLADCDVEAPNDHLFLHRAEESALPVDVLVADVDPSRCAACGACRDACAFGAIRMLGGSAVVFDELCHGCGRCSDVCSRGAVAEVRRRVGEVVVGPAVQGNSLILVTGRLDVGQVKSPSVIRATRSAAAASAADLVVLDAPPGVACSAVAAVRGADALMLVAEPTVFGLHDLELSLQLGRELQLPMGVVINRSQSGSGTAIESLCETWGVPLLARIPFERRIAETYARGELIGLMLPEVGAAIASLPDAMRALASRPLIAR